MFRRWVSDRRRPWLCSLSGAVTLLVPALAHSGVHYGNVREEGGKDPLPRRALARAGGAWERRPPFGRCPRGPSPGRLAIEQLHREQPQASVQIDPITGLVHTLANLRDRHPLAGRGIERATAFVDEHREMLLGDRAVAELAVSNLDALATSSHVRYQQVYSGLPVFGARLSVHLDVQGQVRMVHSSVQPQIEINPTPVLTAADALRVARGKIGAAGLWGQPRVTLGVLPVAGRARLAYRVQIATIEPADWQLDVDARSGALLGQTNRLMRVEGEGVVVDENPDTTPELVRRPFRDLDGSGILKGAFADVYSMEATNPPGLPGPVLTPKRLSQAGDHRFAAPPSDPRFNEQMLYYHVNRAHDYFRRTLGFTERDESLKVYAHMMENTHRYPDDVNHPRTGKPQAHWTGIIWDGACWDLRKALGATVADQLVFRSIYYQPEYGRADFQTAAEGVLEADRELYGSAHEEVIRRVMRQRGILPERG